MATIKSYSDLQQSKKLAEIEGKYKSVLVEELLEIIKKKIAIEEMNYIRRQQILSNVCENKDGILALRLAEMNKELVKL